jgi:hypothetical protein
LYGEGFEGVCSVSFGGTSGFTWAPLRGMLSAQTRGGNPGPVDVAVTCNGERTVIHDGFTFLMPKRRGVR